VSSEVGFLGAQTLGWFAIISPKLKRGKINKIRLRGEASYDPKKEENT
jgi:hypothetical protein